MKCEYVTIRGGNRLEPLCDGNPATWVLILVGTLVCGCPREATYYMCQSCKDRRDSNTSRYYHCRTCFTQVPREQGGNLQYLPVSPDFIDPQRKEQP